MFVSVITALIAIGTVVAVIPGILVIGLLVGVQVVNGALLPCSCSSGGLQATQS